MPFKPNHKLSVGRPKGSINRRSYEVKAILDEAGHCPTMKLVHLARVAEARFEAETELVNSGRYSPMESNAHAYLKMAIDANKELCAFINPKLKAIEQVKTNPLEGMSSQEKLEAMRQGVKFLEAELKGKSGPSDT